MTYLDVNRWGEKSSGRIGTCDILLQRLFEDVIRRLPKGRDATVLHGFRDKADQNYAFAMKRSKLEWPKSAHNKFPSQAIDVWPYPLPKDAAGWSSPAYIAKCWWLRGFVESVAQHMSIPLRPVIEWDPNHYELP